MEELSQHIISLTGSEWVYALIFLLAVAEANAITSYFLSGTIALVIVGVLIAQNMLDPAWSVLAVYGGTLAGDISSFLMSQTIQKAPFVAAGLRRLEAIRAPLAKTPARFILVSHFTPYLRSLLPVLAAGVVPLRVYLAIETVAALIGACFFLGIGYFGANALAGIDYRTAIATVGIAASCVLAAVWVHNRKLLCPSRHNRRAQLLNLRRAVWFYTWYLPWHPVRWVELWLRSSPCRRLRRSLRACFPDIRPGDIFVIRLHAPAPWGTWAHSAIAIDGLNFCHGFSSKVTAHAISALPVRYAIAHLRVRCEEPVAESAAIVARSCVGAPVTIAARRDEITKFSCSSLVAHSYRQVGIELVDPAVTRIVPDDLYSSTKIELIRIVHTEQVRRHTHRYVFEARKEG